MPSTELRPRLDDEAAAVASIRNGDEGTFTALIDELSPALLRLAMNHVPSRAVAEEVVQDSWIAVMLAIDRFEARFSLRRWVFRIVRNNAITRGERERRMVPASASAPITASPGRRTRPEPV